MMQHMLTTVDNPFDPFTEFDAWDSWDRTSGYCCSAYLSRVVKSSDELSEADQMLLIEQGIEVVAQAVQRHAQHPQPPPLLVAQSMVAQAGPRVCHDGLAGLQQQARIHHRRRAATPAAISGNGVRMPAPVSQCTCATWLIAGSAG